MPPEPERKTTIYLIRHGEPSEEFLGKFYGQIDVPLSEKGKRQSLATAERLSSVPFFAIYSSDLQRAVFLADALGEIRDLPVRQSPEFRERCLGSFQGLSEQEMHAKDAEEYTRWNQNRARHRFEGGENFEDLTQRVVSAIEALVKNFDGHRIALVTHAGPIRVTLAHVLGMPLEKIFSLTLDCANVSVIEYPLRGGPRVRMMNG